MTEFHKACEQLKPLVGIAKANSPSIANRLLKLDSRYEKILLMPRASGKTTIGEWSRFAEHTPTSMEGGWLDEQVGNDERELVRTIMGMLRIHREMREQFPNYNPKITLRPETWARIKGNFYFLEPQHVAHLEFPHHAFYSALTEAGATPEALTHFLPGWIKTFTDSRGCIYPGLAFDALAETCLQAEKTDAVATAKWKGAALACSRFVAAQKDVDYWLTYMSPGDKSTIASGNLTIPVDRVLLRIRQARRDSEHSQLPFKLSGPGFITYCEHAGIWKVNSTKYARLALPYAIGASFLRARLTDDAFARMLRE